MQGWYSYQVVESEYLCEIPKLRLQWLYIHFMAWCLMKDMDNFMITNNDILYIWHTEVCLACVNNKYVRSFFCTLSLGLALSDAE